MKRLVPLLGLALAACGGEDSEGFVADSAVCQANPDDVTEEMEGIDLSQAAALTGTSGRQARLGQLLPQEEKRLWGVKLLVAADGALADGLSVKVLKPNSDELKTGRVVTDATIAANNIMTAPSWITVSFDPPVAMDGYDQYWLFLYGNYGRSATTQVRWVTTAGEGLYKYDESASTWRASTAQSGGYRYVACK